MAKGIEPTLVDRRQMAAMIKRLERENEQIRAAKRAADSAFTLQREKLEAAESLLLSLAEECESRAWEASRRATEYSRQKHMLIEQRQLEAEEETYRRAASLIRSRIEGEGTDG